MTIETLQKRLETSEAERLEALRLADSMATENDELRRRLHAAERRAEEVARQALGRKE